MGATVSASMGVQRQNARIAEAMVFASTLELDSFVKSVTEVVFVSMEESNTNAKIVKGAVTACMGGGRHYAKIVAGASCVSMVGRRKHVKIVSPLLAKLNHAFLKATNLQAIKLFKGICKDATQKTPKL